MGIKEQEAIAAVEAAALSLEHAVRKCAEVGQAAADATNALREAMCDVHLIAERVSQ